MTDHDWKNIGKIIKFRIYYGDGTKADGCNAEDWRNCPKENVQVVLLKDVKGDKFRKNGDDLYSMDNDMEIRIVQRDPEIKRGKFLSDEIFHPLFDKAAKEDWDSF